MFTVFRQSTSMLCWSLPGKFGIAKEKPNQVLSDERSKVLRSPTQKSSMLEIEVCCWYKMTGQCVLETRGNSSQTRESVGSTPNRRTTLF
jgi:hypothetical protein